MKSIQHVLWRGALALSLLTIGVGSGIGLPSPEVEANASACAAAAGAVLAGAQPPATDRDQAVAARDDGAASRES